MNEKNIISGKPHRDDKEQVAITEKIRELLLREPWAKEAFREVRDILKSYMLEILRRKDDAKFVHDKTQEVLNNISKRFRAKIVAGERFLSDMPTSAPVLVSTNHFGAYKLLGLKTKEDLNIDMPGYDYMYPYPAYFAAFVPIAQELDSSGLYYTAKEFPGVFGVLHKNTGAVAVPIESPEEGRISSLIDQTEQLINLRGKNLVLVNFPEGTTSGKPSGRGPYDLEPFHSGGYVVASQVGMNILPVAQYFEPDSGFQLRIFEPYVLPKDADRISLQESARKDQKQIQEWLNSVSIKE